MLKRSTDEFAVNVDTVVVAAKPSHDRGSYFAAEKDGSYFTADSEGSYFTADSGSYFAD